MKQVREWNLLPIVLRWNVIAAVLAWTFGTGILGTVPGVYAQVTASEDTIRRYQGEDLFDPPSSQPSTSRLPPVQPALEFERLDSTLPPESFTEEIAPPPGNDTFLSELNNAPVSSEAAAPGGDSGYGGYGASGDTHWGLWGWLSYLRTPQSDFSSFWAYEAQLDVTHSFTQHIAGTAEIDFMDLPGNEVFMEQLFLSVALPDHEETIFTAGKFNSPFGVEPRDFWDRVSASRSLLFRAQPQDLIGVMVTHRIPDTNLYFRPMVVNGFGDTGFDNNEQPSWALMTEYSPGDCLSIGATYWDGPENNSQVGDKLSFVDAHIIWQMTCDFSLAGEYLHASNESMGSDLDWTGYLVLANYDVCDAFRIFAQWSVLDDRDAYQTGVAERRREVNAGFGWYLHPLVEIRAEYRHDYRPISGDRDPYSAHITFGF